MTSTAGLATLAIDTAELLTRAGRLAERFPHVPFAEREVVKAVQHGSDAADAIRASTYDAGAVDLLIQRMWNSVRDVRHGTDALRQAHRGVEKLSRHIAPARDLGPEIRDARVVGVNMSQAGDGAATLVSGARQLARLVQVQQGEEIARLQSNLDASASLLHRVGTAS